MPPVTAIANVVEFISGISLTPHTISSTMYLVALPVAAVLLTTADNKAYENVVDATAVTVKTPLNVLSTPPTLTLLPTVSPWVQIVNVATVPDAALFVTTYVIQHQHALL